MGSEIGMPVGLSRELANDSFSAFFNSRLSNEIRVEFVSYGISPEDLQAADALVCALNMFELERGLWTGAEVESSRKVIAAFTSALAALEGRGGVDRLDMLFGDSLQVELSDDEAIALSVVSARFGVEINEGQRVFAKPA